MPSCILKHIEVHLQAVLNHANTSNGDAEDENKKRETGKGEAS